MNEMTVMATANDSMNGMEHAQDTIFVPPLVDERILSRFCRAIQAYAETQGTGVEAAAKLRVMQSHLKNLVDLASLCRFAVLGDQRAVARVRDEMQCISVDFPDTSLDARPAMDRSAPAAMVESKAAMGSDAPSAAPESKALAGRSTPDPRAQLAAAVDLFAGATFVSAGDPDQCRRFVAGLVRALENAVAFPLSFAEEAASYLGEGDGTLSVRHAAIAIANAAQRLVENDVNCVPRAPAWFRHRLEALANRWMRSNPVSVLLDALGHSDLQDALTDISPATAKAGDTVTLGWNAEDGNRPEGLVVMFSPHQPAPILSSQNSGIHVEVPPRAQSGPVVVVRRPTSQELEEVTSLEQSFQEDYPVEWGLSAFTMIPLSTWAYPVAFSTAPKLDVVQVPRVVSVAVFDSRGRRAEGRKFRIGEEVTLRFRVEPAGSDANVELEIKSEGGTISTHPAEPGTVRYRPTAWGLGSIHFLCDGHRSFTVPVTSPAIDELAADMGSWDAPIADALAIVGVHAVVLRTGRVLYFSFDVRAVNNLGSDSFNRFFNDPNLGSYQVWDPVTETAGPVKPIGRNVFCAGQCQLADGTIFTAGGQDGAGAADATGQWDKLFAAWFGSDSGAQSDVHTYDPVLDQWTRWPDLATGRYYPTCQTLDDGTAFVAGGLANLQQFVLSGGNWAQNDQFETYGNGALGLGPSPHQSFMSADQYPILRLLPGSRHLFVHVHNTTSLFDLDTGRFVPGAQFIPPTGVGRQTYPMQTGYVLLPQREGDAPRILIVGGSTHSSFDYNTQSDAPAVRGAFLFEYNARSPPSSRWRATLGTPTQARLLSDTVLLPDGTVFIVNGIGKGAASGHSSETVFQADLFDPDTETFTPMASPSPDHPRAYHSTAVLLPDGRVAVAGNTGAYNNPAPGGPRPFDDTSIQVYNPPYLFRGPRPTVSSVPATLSYGATTALDHGADPPIARVMMMRPCAVTHTQDMDQRAIWLAASSMTRGSTPGATLTFTMPRDRSLAPPGYYMLFFLSDVGVPSVASFVLLSSASGSTPGTGSGGGGYPTVNLGTYQNGASAQEVHDGDIVIEKIDQHCNVTLESRHGSITINQKCDQHCFVSLKAATSINIGQKIDQHCIVTIQAEGDVAIGQKIDGNSDVTITSNGGSISIGQKIDGNSSATLNAASGTIAITQKVDGNSIVRWHAAAFVCPDTGGGQVTRF